MIAAMKIYFHRCYVFRILLFYMSPQRHDLLIGRALITMMEVIMNYR